MFDVAPDHAIGLYAGLLALPFALIALRLRRASRGVSGTVLGASVLIAMSGAVHLGLVTTHLNEPLTAVLFIGNGTGYLALSQLYTWKHWRLASAALLAMTLLGYVVWIVLGLDTPDQVAIATKLLELCALGLVLIPVRGEPGRHRAWRWSALGVAVPLLTMVVTATVWIDDLARPDAQHVHAGAILQPTNEVATPAQVRAAKDLYDATKAAVAPYADWRVAWAAGYRPGGPSNLPSTHWMNQRYVEAGYVMDPRRPQGLVYANSRHGPVLLGAMFQMKRIGEFGPDPGGPLTAWHEHTNICITPFGLAFSLMTPTATCPAGAIDLTVPAMLHVWIVDNPGGGPFAVDIDSSVVKHIDQL
ncbi:MAG TPA: hypothetical protein VJT78_11115 [Candidatus Dormibacteraeota bacterium]|nr:hypothetical protein [Candidatus Dormibacteraeota bacterium]